MEQNIINTTINGNISTDKDIKLDDKSYFVKVFMRMGIALGVSATSAWFINSNQQIMEIIFSNNLYFFGIIAIELLLIRYISSKMTNISLGLASILFLLYSAINGILLSIIFNIFELNSIVTIFGSTTLLFLIISFYGYTTKSDLTKIGNLAFMGLIGIIISSLINIYIGSTTFDLIITIIGVILFVCFTAYDIQKLKNFNTKGDAGTENERKEALLGALNLYLDFINLFLRLLRLFGKRK